MKFKFKIQKYQTDAVEATADVFAGQPNRTAKYTRDLGRRRDRPENYLSTLIGKLRAAEEIDYNGNSELVAGLAKAAIDYISKWFSEAETAANVVRNNMAKIADIIRSQLNAHAVYDDAEYEFRVTPGYCIKAGVIRSKSGEGFFVLKGEFYDAIEAGRKTTEYRDLTPRNLSLSIGIKTVKFQRGYGHPGKPPKQMRYEVESVGLLDPEDRECDPYAIPPGFIATTIAIHLGKRVG